MIKVENLCKHYDGKELLGDINFNVGKREIFAIIGPSGAGKTTLLRLLDLLDTPTEGRIILDGLEATEKERLELRRRMAMVFQGAPMLNASVFDNVAYGLKIRKVAADEMKNRVKTALELVDLEGYEGRNAKTLSGGEAQRVAFAMATVIQPETLLMDEPTANLDPINEAMVEEIIKRINGLGITIVLATHKQAEAMRLAHRVAVLNKGRIEQIGTPEEIFHKPRTLFVAGFVGTKNIFKGTIVESDEAGNRSVIDFKGLRIELPYRGVKAGAEVHFCIRPEEIMLLREDRPITSRHPNIFKSRITDVHPMGSAMFRLGVKVNDDVYFVVDVPRHVMSKMKLERGKEPRISLKASSCHVIEGS
ncbi:MAG: ABC transporter ATP-binding protein [Candidatus Hydrothermarchaeaceae archaeon]